MGVISDISSPMVGSRRGRAKVGKSARFSRGFSYPPQSEEMTQHSNNDEPRPLVSVIMGSKSDLETLSHAEAMLSRFGVPHECRVVSAHLTPEGLAPFAREAQAPGLQVVLSRARPRPHHS